MEAAAVHALVTVRTLVEADPVVYVQLVVLLVMELVVVVVVAIV